MVASIYLDSNALIAIVERGELDGLVEAVADFRVQLLTSDFNQAEVLVRPLQTGDADLRDTYERILADAEFIQMVPVTTDLLRAVASERAVRNNKTPDAIHVVSALRSGCSLIVSSDKRLRLPEGLNRVSIEVAANTKEWPS